MAGKTCLSHDDYTVGWICALPLEMAAATVMLDEKHEKLRRQPNDHNEYVLGHIGEHNIVVACLPSGEYGIASATTVAMQLLSSFHSIRFGLMVGIGGGVPKEDKDIRLGDIVVSEPTYTHGGVVQYDYGKALSGGEFRRTGMLNRPPQSLLTALSKLQATHYTKPSQVINFLAEIEQKLPTEQAANFARPTQTDQLFLDNYEHTNTHTQTCNGCDTTQTVQRHCRSHNNPFIHYGLIASANQVVKDSQLRDKLGRDLGVLCVEMEAAGLMNNYPCLVIRGICDYADSHKNKEWQGYAAAVAAAYAKELLLTVSADQTRNTRAITNVPSSPTSQDIHGVVYNPIGWTTNGHGGFSSSSAVSDYSEQQWKNVIRARKWNDECFNCGNDHLEDTCWVKCGRCGMRNHTQRDCRMPLRCFKCGGQNHMARYCEA